MDTNILNSVLILVAVLFGFKDFVVMIFGKRIVRLNNEFKNALQFALFLWGFYLILDNEVFSNIALVGFLIIWWYQRYHSGIKYTIYSDNLENLVRDIEIGLREIECEKFEKEQEDKETTFTLEESKKKIILEQKDSNFRKQQTYNIVFKKWKGRESRREMLYLIETSLLEDEGGRTGKFSMGFQFLMLIMGIILALFMMSKSVMEPERLTATVLETPPTKVYLVNEERYIPIDDKVLALHGLAKNAYTNRSMGDRDKKRLMLNAKILFYYGTEKHSEDIREVINNNENTRLNEDGARIIYIEQSSGTAFAPHSEIGNKSLFHKILWRFYMIYKKTEGNYYSVFNQDYNQWKKIVEEILVTY